MEGNIKISVIIPVYNAEKYLKQCLESLFVQTFQDFEALAVDDGSVDASPAILQEYAERDPRLRVFTKEHSNAGEARNLGLEHARGEYLAFLDADDFVDPQFLWKTYAEAQEKDADIVAFRCNQYEEPSGFFFDCPWTLRTWEMPEHRPFSAQDAAEKIFNMGSCTPWDKLFKRSFLAGNNIRFQSNESCNDMLFTYAAQALAERISTIEDILYHQRVGHPKYLAKDIEYLTSCSYKALKALQSFLVEHGIYEIFKKSFVNWAVDFSLSNLHNFDGAFHALIRQQLKREWLKSLDINETPEEDFYVHEQYEEMQALVAEREEELRQIGENPSTQPKVSIIIPIYNVSQYLRLCLDSAINQTLEEIEILAVNDGSTDNCLDIINEYAAKDPRIVVITGPNGGYGRAMNKGLDRATGEYIGIIEPDDFVNVRMFEELYKVAEQNQTDVTKADFYRFTHDERGIFQLNYISIAKEKNNYHIKYDPKMKKDVFKYVMNTWSGIYKREFIEKHHIRHNETPGASFQDNGFWFITTAFAESMYFINKPFYFNRRDNPNSSVANKAKVYCMNEEYALIRKKLSDNDEIMKEFLPQFSAKRFINYIFTYDRLADEYKTEYMEVFHKELEEADKAGEIEWSLFNRSERFYMEMALRSPQYFPAKAELYQLNEQIKKQELQINQLKSENSKLKSENKSLEENSYRKIGVLFDIIYEGKFKKKEDLYNSYISKDLINKPSNKRPNNIIHIVNITDDNYCMPTSVALTSLKTNRNKDVLYKIHILASEINEENRKKILSLNENNFTIDIRDTKVDEKFRSYTKADGDLHVSPAAITKLYLPEILSDIGKVLYFDGDVLINSDLLELYNTSISNSYVAAVKDIISERNPKHLRKLHYPHQYYFNSGVMLLNLTKMRSDKITSKLIDYRLHGRNHFMDQDTLNVVLGKKVQFLSPRYNFLNKFYDWWDAERLSKFYGESFSENKENAIDNAVILHLGSHEKPWKYEMGYLSELYDKYYNMSPYADEPLVREELPT